MSEKKWTVTYEYTFQDTYEVEARNMAEAYTFAEVKRQWRVGGIRTTTSENPVSVTVLQQEDDDE